MKIDADDVAARFGLARDTVIRWARQGRIPAQRRGHIWVFEPAEIESWARENKLRGSGDQKPRVAPPESPATTLVHALRRGGVHCDLVGDDSTTVLRKAADLLPFPNEVKERIYHRLLEREEMASTGVGNGIALPHPRQPEPAVGDEAIVMTCFLKSAVEFAAVDGDPVDVLFLILSPSTKVHLQILSRLAHLVRTRDFRALLEMRPTVEKLVEMAARIDRPSASGMA
jgi:PTS system nitrogen regulatory IIA component